MSLRDPDRRPTNPGALLRDNVLPALKMTQAQLSARLGVSRQTIVDVLHEKRALTPEMALRLSKLTVTTAESWLRMQHAVELWELRQLHAEFKDIKPLTKEQRDA